MQLDAEGSRRARAERFTAIATPWSRMPQKALAAHDASAQTRLLVLRVLRLSPITDAVKA